MRFAGEQKGMNQFIDTNEVDLKEILFKLLAEWRVYVVLLGMGLLIAYLFNRYSNRLYEISALIHVEEKNNPLLNSNVSLMFNWGGASDLIETRKFILLSRSHNERVLDRLNFEVGYYSSGRVKTRDMYKMAPYIVEFDEFHPQLFRTPLYVDIRKDDFDIEIEDRKAYETFNYQSMKTEGVEVKKLSLKNLSYGKWISSDAYRFRVYLDSTIALRKGDESWYFMFENPKKAASSYISRIKVDQIQRGASLVEIKMRGTNKKRIADYINATIAELMRYELEEKNRLATNTIEFVDKQIKIVRDSLSNSEGLLEKFRSDNLDINISQETGELYSEYVAVEKQRATLQLERRYYEYLREYISENDDLSAVMAPSVVGIQDAMLISLLQKAVELSVKLNRMAFSLEVDNPAIVKLKGEIQLMKDALLENLNSLIATTDIKLNETEEQLASAQLKLSRLPGLEQNLININRKYELNNEQFLFLLQKRSEAAIVKAASIPETKVIDPAMDVGQAALKPDAQFSYIVALGLALLIPTLFFLGRDIIDQKIKTKEELERATMIPLLGMIGHSRGQRNLVIKEGMKSSMAESFRLLRTNLKFLFDQKKEGQGRVLLTTSSVGGEGKTFCSINLASMIAIGGSKVVLIGMDMRKPKIFNDFGLSNEIGLSNYLIHQSEISEIIQKTNVNNLDLISAGPVPPNPSELIISPRLEALINTLRKQYDYVVLDTPPVGLVVDAIELMKFSDANLYVVRQNYTRKPLLNYINEQFHSKKVGRISVVFNDVKSKKLGYGYGYG
ncbi:MAG TPA: hypothetical protein DDX92_09780, partial [Flavobacteriales bacterium]|nr:hypothetical protein [Flavobacteriales bacterium]